MSRRRDSATALKASEVVAARAMRNTIHSHIRICQAPFHTPPNGARIAPFSEVCSNLSYCSPKTATSKRREGRLKRRAIREARHFQTQQQSGPLSFADFPERRIPALLLDYENQFFCLTMRR